MLKPVLMIIQLTASQHPFTDDIFNLKSKETLFHQEKNIFTFWSVLNIDSKQNYQPEYLLLQFRAIFFSTDFVSSDF